MKVHKCRPKQEAAAVNKECDLTYDQILLKEGVYVPVGDIRARIIVLRAADNKPAVLWYNSSGQELVTASAGWDKFKFREVKGAEICFEIREPK